MLRQRLTITLSPKIVSRVDALVNGKLIRNRSHAIEWLLKQSLPSRVSKALILAGGKGRHFRPLTDKLPTALIPFRGKTLLEHQLELIKGAGIVDITLCLGHLGEKIKERFGDGRELGVKLSYSLEKKPLGTAGAILHAKEQIGDESVLVMHSDILIDIDLDDLLDFHNQEKYLSTIVLATVPDPKEFGMVKVKGMEVVDFLEKPARKKDSNLINAGVYILEPKILELIKKYKYRSMERQVFPQLAKEGRVAAYLNAGKWFDVSYPEIYEKALKNFNYSLAKK